LKSKIGHISLIFAITGFLLIEAAIHLGWVVGPLWRIIATGFEAATIGALADWFAVSALFYEIPIPLVRRHTNIIVKNRKKLTEGIVEMVTTKWLSPEIIEEKLADVNIARHIIKLLEEPQNLSKTLDFLRQVLIRFTENLDDPKMAFFIQKLLQDQVKDIDLAHPLGKWLEDVILKNQHHAVTSMIITEISKALQAPETRRVIRLKMKQALEAYSKEDRIKQATVWLAKKTGGIDLDLLTDRIMDITLVLSEETKEDPRHPLRLRLDGFLMEFARHLKEGEPQSVGFINALKEKLIVNEEAGNIIQKILANFQVTIQGELAGLHTELMNSLLSMAQRLLDELKDDIEAQNNIDRWMKESIAKMIKRYHPEIGNLVRSSLGKLDDKEMMYQIKEKVGDDLQYIRLNGAVVGGLVGITIAVIRWILV
jgi:uncharacterized membrane-anchored protein YjiN (DUF445 family)